MSKSRRNNAVVRSIVVAVTLFTVSACSSNTASDETASDETASDETASDETASDENTTAPSVADAGGDCSDVPSEAEVEAVTGMAFLPVEYSEFTGCGYIGDGNNAGVYFERQTSEEDLAHFASPDPAFAEPVTDPELAGAFTESGDLYASLDSAVFAVFAGVTGTDADDGLAIELMKLWLANVG